METKSKKVSAVAMIIGGLIVFTNYLLKPDTDRTSIPQLIVMICAVTFIFLGVYLIRKVNKKQI